MHRLLDAIGLVGGGKIGSLNVMPLTAAKWGFLWGIENPLVARDLPAETVSTVSDMDVFLFVLALRDLRKLTISFSELPGAASGYAAATGLAPEDVVREIHQVKQSAFHAFEMLPEVSGDGDSPHYDADWLTLLTGIAAREMQLPADRVMHEIPLSTRAVSLYPVSPPGGHPRERGQTPSTRGNPENDLEKNR